MGSILPFYGFGPFRLDAEERVLLSHDKPVQLTLKAFSVLLILVENAGHVVEKDQFMRQVWPDMFVEDNNLIQSIALLRRVLCENHDRHEYIQTVYRRGYRFIATVYKINRVRTTDESATDKQTEGDPSLEKSARSSTDTTQKPSAPWPNSCASCKFLMRHPRHEEARHLYSRGRYYWSKYTVEGLLKGINYFRDAIKIDPNYSLAHVGLAGCYYRLSNIHLQPNQAMSKAKLAATHALEIDEAPAEAHAEAHALLGLIETFYKRDWATAETQFGLAIALTPNSASVHNRYGWALGMLGHFDRGITELKRALSLAPLSSEYQVGLGIVFHMARQHTAAIDQAQLALDLDPDFYAAHALLGMAYLQEQNVSEGLAELQQAASLAKVTWTMGYLGYAYAVAHKPRMAFDLLAELEQLSKRSYVSPYSVAVIHAGLGDQEQALRALERTCEDRNEMFGFVKASPEFQSLHSEKRFQALFQPNLTFASD